MTTLKEITPDYLIEAGKEWTQQLLSVLPLEERLLGLKPEEVLKQYKPEEVLKQYKPEEILANLPQEKIEQYLKTLKEKSKE